MLNTTGVGRPYSEMLPYKHLTNNAVQTRIRKTEMKSSRGLKHTSMVVESPGRGLVLVCVRETGPDPLLIVDLQKTYNRQIYYDMLAPLY